MKSFLEHEGLYIPGKRFAFTNISSEVFTSKWNGVPVVVEPNTTIEISDTTPISGLAMGHNLAVKFTTELVDHIMQGEAKMDELAHSNIPYYKSPKGGAAGVPATRKVYEDKILRELSPEEDSPRLQSAKLEFRQQLEADLRRTSGERDERSDTTPNSVNEFATVRKDLGETKAQKKAASTKKIKVTEPASTVS